MMVTRLKVEGGKARVRGNPEIICRQTFSLPVKSISHKSLLINLKQYVLLMYLLLPWLVWHVCEF